MALGGRIASTAAGLMRCRPLGGQEEAALDLVCEWLASHDVVVSRQQVPAASLEAHPYYSAEIDRSEVPVVIAEVRGAREGPTLLLNAHVDVVPADAGHWFTDPFAPVLLEDRLVGRGAADTLGGLAAAMHVMADLAAAPDFAGRVLLTPVVGEEDGGGGTLAGLVAGEVTADAAVVIEPTGLDIAPASAGALCFAIHVPGRTAHGSVRHLGVSAIEKAFVVHQALRELEAQRARALRHPLQPDVASGVPFPICIGRIEGGDYRCDEAAWARLEGRFGTPPDEPLADARAALERAVAEAAAADPWLVDHPPDVEWIGAQWVGGDTAPDHAIVAAARAARPDAAVVGVPYGCDLGLLDQVGGIPGVVCGPGSAAQAHGPDEFVLLDDLGRAAQALRRIIEVFPAQVTTNDRLARPIQ